MKSQTTFVTIIIALTIPWMGIAQPVLPHQFTDLYHFSWGNWEDVQSVTATDRRWKKRSKPGGLVSNRTIEFDEMGRAVKYEHCSFQLDRTSCNKWSWSYPKADLVFEELVDFEGKTNVRELIISGESPGVERIVSSEGQVIGVWKHDKASKMISRLMCSPWTGTCLESKFSYDSTGHLVGFAMRPANDSLSWDFVWELAWDEEESMYVIRSARPGETYPRHIRIWFNSKGFPDKIITYSGKGRCRKETILNFEYVYRDSGEGQ